jgi:BioD-like phosphotransacetylase family protein
MASYALLSPAAGAGKTTVAVALSQNLLKAGRPAAFSRSGDDANASADSSLFQRLTPGGGEIAIVEAAGGETTAEGPALVVIDAGKDAAATVEFCRSLGGKVAGVVLNRVPSRRQEAAEKAFEAAGLRVLFAIPEDRLLATPTLSGVATALNSQPIYFDSNGDRPLDRPAIAPISADPGQGYFSRTEANAVIVRSDKPDLQLAALNAGASCLIVTGGFPFLGYVLERAEADEIPLIPTKMSTVETVKVIESLYAKQPFSGGEAPLARLLELTGGIETALLGG